MSWHRLGTEKSRDMGRTSELVVIARLECCGASQRLYFELYTLQVIYFTKGSEEDIPLNRIYTYCSTGVLGQYRKNRN